MHTTVSLNETQLAAATETLYALMLGDDDLSPFFDGMDVGKIEHRQRQFLSLVINGSPESSQVDLRKVHAPLLARGLNHHHFDKMLDHLETALEEAGVDPATRAALGARVEAYREEVLGDDYTHFPIKEKPMFGRITIALYAIVSYTIGMATLVFSAAWMGGFLVPTPLDAPASFSVLALLANIGLVVMFGLQHSIMARPAFKAKWTKIIPPAAERSTYILASSIAMFAMMWFWQPLGVDIWRLDGAAAVALYALFGVGWVILVSSTFFLNHFDLFGLRQAWLNLRGMPYTHVPFATPGYYRWVRHPIYVGWLVAIWATPTMTISHLVFALATTVYILAAIPMEERDLEAMLPEYKDYKATTPSLVPRPQTKTPKESVA